MHKFSLKRKHKFGILGLSVLVCLGFISFSVATRNNKAVPPFVQRFGNDVVGIANYTVAFPMNTIRHGGEVVNNLVNTYKENQQLKSEVENVTSTKVQSQALQSENKQLKQELNIKGGLTDYKSIVAEALSRTPSTWEHQLIINKGKSAGVTKNMPVISNHGLVGRIVEVNNSNSKVELISDTVDTDNKFSVEVTDKHGTVVNGIINGYKRQTGELIMGHFNINAKVKPGDKVVTNGLGGITPKGLYVGEVSKVTTDDYGTAKKMFIKIPANMNDLEVVTIVDKIS